MGENQEFGAKYPASKKEKEKRILEKREKQTLVNPGRRLFLKVGATALASGAASWYGLNKLKDLIEKQRSTKIEEEKKILIKEKVETQGAEKPPIKEEALVSEEDIQSLEQIISFNPEEKIVLDNQALEKVKNYWRKAYENKLKVDLDRAWRKMGFWEDSARESFLVAAEKYCTEEKMGKEEKMVFLKKFGPFFDLAIPESHWDVWADSGVAVGPFQFTAQTAHDYDLKRRENYDERTDPEKSAFAAARCLLGMYKAMNKDWGLVLSGYNGSFIWGYWKDRKNGSGGKKQLSLGDYMLYLSEKIEKIKKEALFEKKLMHKITKKASWKKIANLYGCDEQELINLNEKNFKKGLVVDRWLVLPEGKNVRKRYFYHKISGFSENINYPAKFLAVMEVLEKRKEKNDLPQKETPPFSVAKKIIHQKKGYRKIKTGPGDSLASLATRFKTSPEVLIQINRLKSKKPVLKKIMLVPEEKITLLSLAGGNNGLVELLHKLNPAIQKVDQPVPNGLEVKMLTLTDFLIAKKTEK